METCGFRWFTKRTAAIEASLGLQQDMHQHLNHLKYQIVGNVYIRVGFLGVNQLGKLDVKLVRRL